METLAACAAVAAMAETQTINPDTATKRVLITHKEVVGHMAHWALRQHPYGRPDGLFDVTDALTAAAQEWPEGVQTLRMMWVDGCRPIEAWLRSALRDHPALTQWNTPKSGHTGNVFVSRHSGPRAEDDFIDIDALLRNVAMSVWKEAEANV